MVEVTLNQPQPEQRPAQSPAPRRHIDPSAFDASANGCEVVVDSAGRQLAVREISALEQFDLYELLGAKNAENTRSILMANMAACVRAIDGQVMIFPRRTSELRAAIQTLDHHGLVAVAEWRMAKAGVSTGDDESPRDDGVELAKN